ncbi:MAG: protein kinase [Bacteroidales bacterium]|nr:protein kinase [Bacteroidales bacterium]
METSIRGYSLKEIVQSNDFYSVYNAEHAILKGQELRITVLRKEIADDSKIRSAFNQSIFKLAFVEHPNIARNIDMLEENDKLVVLSEKEDYTHLQDFVFKYSVDTKLTICEKVLNAVIYLNSRNIYVTVLNPDCVMINHERQPKMINAGLINIFMNTDNEEIINSLKNYLSFSAPEIKDNPKNIGEKSDVYTCSLFTKFIFGNGDLIDDHHDLSNVPIYLHNIISKGLSENPNMRYKNVSDFLKNLASAVCANTQISGSYISDSEIQPEINVSHDVISGMPEIDEIKTNKIDFNIEEEVNNIDIPEAPLPLVEKVAESDNKPNGASKSMNYYDVLAAIEAEKNEQIKPEMQKKSSPIAEQQVRSSSYVPKADPESKSGKIAAKKEENRAQQQQSQSYNKPPQPEVNNSYQTRTQQQSQSYNQPPQQSSNVNYQTRSQQQQNTYSQHQPPAVSVNTAGIVVLGFLGIVFSFALPLVGFILAIIGLSQLPKQKQKLLKVKRDFSQSEKTNRAIGTIFSIIALLVSVIRMLIFVVNLVS